MEQTLDQILIALSQDESIPAEARLRVVTQLHGIPSPLQGDRWIYRTIVIVLGATALITVLGGIIIYGISAATIPGEIVALGSAAVGALAGLLAPSPVRQS